MSDARSGSIAVVCEGSYDDSNTPWGISFVDDFFDLGGIFVESGSAFDGAFDDFGRDSFFFCGMDCVCKCRVEIWIRSLLGGNGNDFYVERVDFGSCLRRGFFFLSNDRSASHGLESKKLGRYYREKNSVSK